MALDRPLIEQLVNALIMAREELVFGGDWETAKAIATKAITVGQEWLTAHPE